MQTSNHRSAISPLLVLTMAIGSFLFGSSAFAQNTEEELKKVEALFGDLTPKEPAPKKQDAKKGDAKKPVEKEGEVEGKIAAPRVAVPAMRAQIAAPGQEVQETLAKVVQVELAFLRRAVKLSKEQEEHLTTLDAAWIKKNVRPPIDNIMNGVAINFAGGRVSMNSIQKSVIKAITKEMDATLTPEQAQAYLDEKKAREKFVVEANIDGVLLLLDKKLSLRSEQVANIRKTLVQGGIGETDIRMYIQNPNYLPPLPEASIVRHLDATQKEVFRGLQQVEFGAQPENLEVVINR